MEYIENGKHFDKNEHKDLIPTLENAVKEMHSQDYVHGDLRTPNILVKDNKVFIVDFDWAGKEGEVFYSLLNPAAFDSECEKEGIRSGQQILKNHDTFMINRLKRD